MIAEGGMRICYGTIKEISKAVVKSDVRQLSDEVVGSAGGAAAALSVGVCDRHNRADQGHSIDCYLWLDHDRRIHCGLDF